MRRQGRQSPGSLRLCAPAAGGEFPQGEEQHSQGMMTFSDLASVPSDPPALFTDQLRLAGAAYLAMVRSVPPGRLDRDAAGELSADDERGPAQWTLDTLPGRPATPGSPWGAARCGGSCWPRRCAGGGRIVLVDK